MRGFEAARRETLRYHSAAFAASDRGGHGWWARPNRLVADAVDLATAAGVPVHAYDLGSGTGRHAILAAARLPSGSRVTAVDVLPAALHLLAAGAQRAGVPDRVDTVVADIEEYTFPQPDAGLVVGFSVLEHARSPAALSAVLDRWRRATVPGGLHVIAVFADRIEVGTQGARPAIVECPLTAAQVRELLRAAYLGWDVLHERTSASATTETRHGQAYELRSTLVGVIARAPSGCDGSANRALRHCAIPDPMPTPTTHLPPTVATRGRAW